MAVTDRTLTGGRTVPGQRKGDPVGAEEPAAPVRKGTKKLVGAAVLLVALLAAGGGGFVLIAGGAPAEGATEAAEGAEAVVEPEPGAVLPLEAITINLADGRYLQVGIALQEAAADGGHSEKTDGSKALDILIEHLSGRQMSELATAEQREAVKAELVHDIEEAYHHHVYDVYFTQFVMQ